MTARQPRRRQSRPRPGAAGGSGSSPRRRLGQLRELETHNSAERALYKTSQWQRLRKQVCDRLGGLCVVCDHGGSTSADHVESRSERPDIDFFDVSNLAPIHAWPKMCVQCSHLAGKPVYCQQIKGMGSLARAKRIIGELTGQGTGEVPGPEPEGRL